MVTEAIASDRPTSGSEFDADCLFLNPWRPAAIKPGARLPVLVWMNGAGFLRGGSSAPAFFGACMGRLRRARPPAREWTRHRDQEHRSEHQDASQDR
ncbi:MAG: carboxylesterase family protein [Hyphomicrobiaceae bacterium]|nr:carboxylesterase family protein [Hyphomicrobiaceae bacterium]